VRPLMKTDVKYLASESWDEQMPARLRWLREHDPVHWSEKDQVWLVTRYDDVSSISKNQELYSSAFGVRADRAVKIGLIDEPEPRHTQLRNLINRGFTPRMVRSLEVAFRRIVDESIDAVAARGECDFVREIAVPLPLRLIAEMIGIRNEDFDRFHHWSDAMIAGDGATDPAVLAGAGKAFVEYSHYVTEIIEDRREHPREDLVSVLVGAKDEGILGEFQRSGIPGEDSEQLALANNELIMLLVILLVAGNETTRNGISGGMQLLIENPAERQKLIDDPALIPAAVEEMVRLVSPVHSFSRTVMRDVELRGKRIREGQRVLLLYPSANRDADAFPEPDRFRVERNPVHLGFGIGKHYCLGANLARMEMRIAFSELLRRIPDMRYATGGPVILPSALVRSCVEMQVRFTPERRPAEAA
jgi:cytochrome P450 family 142 subfamily A polypeptide 1